MALRANQLLTVNERPVPRGARNLLNGGNWVEADAVGVISKPKQPGRLPA